MDKEKELRKVKVRLLLCRSLTSRMQRRRKENLKMMKEEPREEMCKTMTSSGTPGGLEETGQGKEQGRSQKTASHLSRSCMVSSSTKVLKL